METNNVKVSFELPVKTIRKIMILLDIEEMENEDIKAKYIALTDEDIKAKCQSIVIPLRQSVVFEGKPEVAVELETSLALILMAEIYTEELKKIRSEAEEIHAGKKEGKTLDEFLNELP